MPFYQGFSGTSQIRSFFLWVKGLWNRHCLISKNGVVICAAQIRGGHRPLATDPWVRKEQRHWARFHRSDGHWHHHLADGPVGIDKIHFFIIYTIFNDQLSAGGKLRAHIIFFEGDLWKWRGTIVQESAHSLLSRGIHLLRRWATSAWQHAKERVQLKSFPGACISMDRRCDQFPNCKDFSDEESIDLVLGNYFWKSTKGVPWKTYLAPGQLPAGGEGGQLQSWLLTIHCWPTRAASQDCSSTQG